MTAQAPGRSALTYTIVDEDSTVEVTGKSSLHPMHGVLRPGSLSGWLKVNTCDGQPLPGEEWAAHLEFPITQVSFGNSMYDRELPRRVEANRYPQVTIDVDSATTEGAGHWRLRLRVNVHGVEQAIEGAATVTTSEDGSVSVRGVHHIDITRFGLQPPKKFGLKVHREFKVALDLVGRLEASG